MGRTPCCSKEQGLNRGAWTAMEDKILTDYIKTYGQGRWRNIPKKAGLNRCGKSCRLRWLNYLRPGIKRGNISEDEEELIVRLHKLLGNRWALIAGRLPGRTDNEIKNYWNTVIGKKITNQPFVYAPPSTTTLSPPQISTHSEPQYQSKPYVPTIKRSFSSIVELRSLPDPHITRPEDLKMYKNVIASPAPEIASSEEPISPASNIVENDNSTNFPALENFMMDFFDIDHDFISDILNTVELSQLVATNNHYQRHHQETMAPILLPDQQSDFKSIASFDGAYQSDRLHQDS